MHSRPGGGFSLTVVGLREVRIESQWAVDLDAMPQTAHVMGDTIVASAVASDPTDAWAEVTRRSRRDMLDTLDVRAFSTADGKPARHYAPPLTRAEKNA